MIEWLKLTNFKNFQDAKLDLGRFTVLVGTNASGKSNLRDAFRFLHGIGRGYSLSELFGEKWGEGGELQWHGIRGGTREAVFRGMQSFALECQFEIPGGQPSERYEIQVEPGTKGKPPRVLAERLSVASEEYFRSFLPQGKRSTQTRWLSLQLREPSRKHGNGAPRPPLTILDMRPALTQLSDGEEVKPARVVRRAARYAAMVFRSMRFLDLRPEAMRQPSVPGQLILGDRGENLSSVLQEVCRTPQKKHAILEWIRQLTPLDVEDFDFVSDAAGRVLVTLIEAGGQRISANSASDGTLRFLAVVMVQRE